MGFFTSLLVFAITSIVSELLRPKPEVEDARPSNVGDFFQTATEGRSVPLVWGTVQVRGLNLLDHFNFRAAPIKKKVKTGLFSSQRQIVGYTYHLGFQLGICLGEVGSLRRLWVGEKELISTPIVGDGTLSIDEPEFFGGDDVNGRGGIVGDFEFFTGSETQSASTILSGHQVISGQTPAYLGTSYIVFDGSVGTSPNLRTLKAEVQRIPDGLDLATAHSGQNDAGDHIVSTYDANPMNVIYDILTDSRWGVGVSPSSIDLDSFRTAGGTVATEGNGVSMVIDTQRDALELIREVERQVDGVLVYDQASEKFQFNLSRGGYDIDLVPQLTDATVVSVESFTRANWSDLTPDLKVRYSDRAKEYAETHALAQDQAAIQAAGGVITSATENYPGVKNAALANDIAWRQLRTLAYPIAKMRARVDRSAYSLLPGDVVAYTSESLSITKMPFRVQRVDYGTLEDGTITLDLVEDIFETFTGSFAPPPDTNWTPPADTPQAIPANEQVVIEAPRKIVNLAGVTPNRVFVSARYQNDNASLITINQDSSGSYVEDGQILSGFCLIGELDAAVSAGTANPTGVSEDIVVSATPDSEAALLAEFFTGATEQDVGTELVNVIYVGGEFMGVQASSDGGTNLVDLGTVWRGLLDTVPKDHAAGEKVYLVFAANALNDTALAPDEAFNVRLTTKTATGDTLAIGSATTIALTFADRYRQPYPPTALELNTVLWDDPVDVDTLKQGGTSSDHEDRGIDLEWIRRDFRHLNEVENIQVDAVTRDSAFLTDTTTQYQVEIIDDPDGSPTTLITTAWNSGEALEFISRTAILNAMSSPGTVPATLRAEVSTRHTIDGDVVQATGVLGWTFDVTSALSNDQNFGALAQNVASSNWSAPATGTYNISIGSAFSSGTVQVNVNGTGFVQPTGWTGTAGTFTANALQTIAVRHTSPDGSLEKFCEILAPSGTVNAYAIFV